MSNLRGHVLKKLDGSQFKFLPLKNEKPGAFVFY
jgi:hypothetical protein